MAVLPNGQSTSSSGFDFPVIMWSWCLPSRDGNGLHEHVLVMHLAQELSLGCGLSFQL